MYPSCGDLPANLCLQYLGTEPRPCVYKCISYVVITCVFSPLFVNEVIKSFDFNKSEAAGKQTDPNVIQAKLTRNGGAEPGGLRKIAASNRCRVYFRFGWCHTCGAFLVCAPARDCSNYGVVWVLHVCAAVLVLAAASRCSFVALQSRLSRIFFHFGLPSNVVDKHVTTDRTHLFDLHLVTSIQFVHSRMLAPPDSH